jgi:hypothetical protein
MPSRAFRLPLRSTHLRPCEAGTTSGGDSYRYVNRFLDQGKTD